MHESTPALNFDSPFRVVAIVAAYNEGDVIFHVIRDLVENEIEVYVIDHGSTDNTAAEAAKFLGRGVLRIERFPGQSGAAEAGETFCLERLLRRKEEIAQHVAANWFIHADADQFRRSPWPTLNLARALQTVDAMGYTAAEFSNYTFRPVDNRFTPGDDVREHLALCEHVALPSMKIDAWKKPRLAKVDLCSTGGREAVFPDRRTFPVPFILQHYPIRSAAHGQRKVLSERLPRIPASDVVSDAVLSYQSLAAARPSFLWSASELTSFDLKQARLDAFQRACQDLLVLNAVHGAPLERTPSTPALLETIANRLGRPPRLEELDAVEKASMAFLEDERQAAAPCASLSPAENLVAQVRLEIEAALARASGRTRLAAVCARGERAIASLPAARASKPLSRRSVVGAPSALIEWIEPRTPPALDRAGGAKGLKTVHFWTGENFTFLNRLALVSQVVVGHHPVLHLYGPEPTTPYWIRDVEGIEIRPLLETSDLSAYDREMQRRGVSQHERLRLVSDLWRFGELYRNGGCYLDSDIISLESLEGEGEVFSASDEVDAEHYSIAILKVTAPGHPVLHYCIRNIRPYWGNVLLFSEACRLHGVPFTHARDVFFPYSWHDNFGTNGLPRLVNDKAMYSSKTIHYYGFHTSLMKPAIDETWCEQYPDSVLAKLVTRFFDDSGIPKRRVD